MARDLDLRGQIKMEGGDKAVSQLEDIADAAKEAEKPVDIKFKGNAAEIAADVENVLSVVDKLKGTDAAKLVLTSNATEITSEIAGLVLELGQLDDPHEIDIKVDQIKALETGLGQLSDKAKTVVAETGGLGGAMGNAFGQASEDLAGLVGVSGTAQQAIGDLAGDLVNAATSAEGLAGSIGSIGAGAGLAAAAILINQIKGAMDAAAETKAFRRERVDAFVDALRDAKLTAGELQDVLSKGGEGEGIFVRIGDETRNADKAVAHMFGTMENFNTQIDKGKQGYDAWADSIVAQNKAAGASEETLGKLRRTLDDASDGAVSNTAAVVAQSDGLRVVQEAAVAYASAIKDSGTASDEAGFQSRFYGDSLAEVAAQQEAAKQTAIDYANVLASADWQTSTIDAATAAFTKLGQEHFAVVNIAAQAEAAYDSLGASIKENGANFDIATEAGRANSEQIQQLYSSLIPSLAKAFDDSDGSLSKFQTNMNKLSTETFNKLRTEAGLTQEQTQAVMQQLGAFDGSTYSSTFELLGAEDASYKLGLLQGVLGSLDPVIQQQVALDIIADDPVAALARVQAAITGGPQPEARVAIEPGTDNATPAIEGITGTEWTTSVAVGGDNKEGIAKVEEVDTTAKKTKPLIDIGANIEAAIVTMALINYIAQKMAPVINVGANTFPAIGAAAAATQLISSMHATVPVTATLRSYPSAASIAASIGTVRVPVDTYLRNEVRVTGGRP